MDVLVNVAGVIPPPPLMALRTYSLMAHRTYSLMVYRTYSPMVYRTYSHGIPYLLSLYEGIL